MSRGLGLALALCLCCRGGSETERGHDGDGEAAAAARRFRDTEGRTFAARCDPRGVCQVEPVAAAHAPRPEGANPAATPAFQLGVWGRYHVLCDTWRGSGPEHPETLDRAACRAIACDSDADCLPAYGLPGVRCAGGLCGDPSRPLGPMDVAVLCQAGTGVPHRTELQTKRSILAGNCTPPCEVPAPCRQPPSAERR